MAVITLSENYVEALEYFGDNVYFFIGMTIVASLIVYVIAAAAGVCFEASIVCCRSCSGPDDDGRNRDEDIERDDVVLVINDTED